MYNLFFYVPTSGSFAPRNPGPFAIQLCVLESLRSLISTTVRLGAGYSFIQP